MGVTWEEPPCSAVAVLAQSHRHRSLPWTAFLSWGILLRWPGWVVRVLGCAVEGGVGPRPRRQALSVSFHPAWTCQLHSCDERNAERPRGEAELEVCCLPSSASPSWNQHFCPLFPSTWNLGLVLSLPAFLCLVPLHKHALRHLQKAGERMDSLNAKCYWLYIYDIHVIILCYCV